MAGVVAVVGEFLGSLGAAEGVGALGAAEAGSIGAELGAGVFGGAEALGLGASEFTLGGGLMGTGVDLLGGAAGGFAGADLGGMLAAFGAGGASGGGGGGLGSLFSSFSAKDALSAGSNLYGLSLANKMRKQSDPFAQYRGAYGGQLAALEANPSSITTRPGYQAGLQAVQRGAAAGGYTGSGNEMAALQQFGGNFYNQEANRLATLAGAGATPGAGSAQAAQLAGQSLAGFGYTQPVYRRPGG